MVRANVATFKKAHYANRHIRVCFRCGVAFEEGDRIMVRKRGPSYEGNWVAGQRLSVVEQIRRGKTRMARAYHVDTCYYTEPLAAK